MKRAKKLTNGQKTQLETKAILTTKRRQNKGLHLKIVLLFWTSWHATKEMQPIWRGWRRPAPPGEMSTVYWNARGSGGKRAFLLIQHLVVELKPSLLFVSDVKVLCKSATGWLSALNMYDVFGVDPRGNRGGLLLFWNRNINVSLRSYSFAHIDVDVV